jgi:release factor glutamine methyltransferase
MKQLKGVSLVIKKGVFSPDPKKTNSTLMILNDLKEIKGKNILDVGCGSGIIGIYCALNGAKSVIATDVDEKAIENTKENIERNKVETIVKVIKSDLFENIKGKFDYIFGNLPIVDKSWNLDISTIDLMKRFICGCKNHIKRGGVVYFTWNSESDVTAVKKILIMSKYKFEQVVKETKKRTWYLFKIYF